MRPRKPPSSLRRLFAALAVAAPPAFALAQQPAPAPAPAPTPTTVNVKIDPGAVVKRASDPPPAPAPGAGAGSPRPRRARGARPSPRERIFAAPRHRASATVAVPPSFGVVPKQLSIWGNDVYGDCVSAEEAFAKAAYSLMYGGTTEVFVGQATVEAWARSNGYLNGADLTSVMDSMARAGMTASDGKTYTDGPYVSVDYTNDTVLSSAIYAGPVKIGVAADQLENVVGGSNGWVATGFGRDQAEDHCVSLCGFGTMGQLAAMVGATPPPRVNASTRGYLLFTWGTVGVIDQPSLVAIAGEAWLRTPTTPPGPGPSPAPAPTPSGLTYTLGPGAPPGASIDATGVFTWAVPATQPPGTLAVGFTVSASASPAATPAAGTFTVVVSAAAPATLAVQPIPPQAAVAGQTMTLDLGRYVTQTAGARP